jgi:hypothetical protein
LIYIQPDVLGSVRITVSVPIPATVVAFTSANSVTRFVDFPVPEVKKFPLFKLRSPEASTRGLVSPDPVK